MKDECELDQKIWAAATQTEVLAKDVTYNEAVAVVNRNLNKIGIAIITSQAAEKQLKIAGQRARE